MADTAEAPVSPSAAAIPRGSADVVLARTVIQVGIIAAALAAVTFREFELDRFYVPKELALHATALLAAALLLRRFRESGMTLVDGLLTGFVLLSAVSAIVATNRWLSFRALAISTSALLLFWAGSAIARSGRQRPLVTTLAAAVVAGAGTALLQAYGVTFDVFSPNRAPGGTLGNRNSIAHLAAFGLPLVMLCALWARRWYGYLAGACGTLLVMTALVLTRSRAAWLALAAVVAILMLALLLGPALRRSRRTLLRMAGLVLLGAAGAAAAVLVPNTLQWRSDSPYLDSLRGVAQYQEGSGAGRLIQYRQSLAMAAAAPMLGVGPGNWPVIYPEHAAPRDPSMSGGTPGTTSNPWPSSDWIAFISERGYAAAFLLALAFAAVVAASARRLRSADNAEDALAAAAAPAMVIGVIVAGLFDAVLLLGLPAFLVFVTLGALDTSPLPRRGRGLRAVLALALLLVSAAGVARSSAQIYSMGTFTRTSDAAALNRAASIDPGNFRLRVRLARAGSGLPRDERCRHARAAHSLMPSAQEARTLSRRC